MSPAGWEALGQWGEDVARIEPLAGGVANDVWSVRVHGHLAVGRLGGLDDRYGSRHSHYCNGAPASLQCADHSTRPVARSWPPANSGRRARCRWRGKLV
jgi:hypothetical protein